MSEKKEKNLKLVKNKMQKEIIKKKFQGVVMSDKQDKTIVVRVDRVKVHPKYKKRFTRNCSNHVYRRDG